jgi:hypothetical protein
MWKASAIVWMWACAAPNEPRQDSREAPAACTLQVVEGPLTLAGGDTATLTTTGAQGDVRFASDDPAVAWVSPGGEVAARSEGAATITVSDAVCSQSVEVTVPPSRCDAAFFDDFAGAGLDPTWEATDIGGPGVPGSHTQVAGTLSIEGAGDDIWWIHDQFYFLQQTSLNVRDDFVATVKVLQVENVQEWTKGALMIRDELTADARFVALMATPGDMPDRLQHRPTAGDVTYADGTDTGLRFPYWLRLEKTGNEFTASLSEDGEAFVPYQEVVLDFVDTLHVGLGVTSNDPFRTARVVFDDFRIECP